MHTTFQYSGAVGKLHRLREAQLWLDEPEYYQPQGGVLAYKPTVRRELAKPSCDPKPPKGTACMDVESHFTLVHAQLVQIRAAFLLAARLGREHDEHVAHHLASADKAAGIGGSAAAVNLEDGQTTTTLESKTNFIRPIAIGETATARCEALHRGRRTTIWQTTVLREDGKPAAIVIQTQMTLSAAG